MDEPYQPPATDPAHKETPLSPRERRAGPVARFLSSATILIAIALIFTMRSIPPSTLLETDTFPTASPPFLRILVLDHPNAPLFLAILFAVIGGAVSFTRKVSLGLALAFAAALFLLTWASILFWVINHLIKGVTG